MTRPDMSIKVERKLHNMRIFGQDCGSAKYGTIRKASFDLNIFILTTAVYYINIRMFNFRISINKHSTVQS